MLSSLFSIWWVALSLVEGTQMQHTSLYGLMHIAQWVYDYHETRCPILTKGNLLRLQNIFIAERKEKRHRVYFLLLVFFIIFRSCLKQLEFIVLTTALKGANALNSKSFFIFWIQQFKINLACALGGVKGQQVANKTAQPHFTFWICMHFMSEFVRTREHWSHPWFACWWMSLRKCLNQSVGRCYFHVGVVLCWINALVPRTDQQFGCLSNLCLFCMHLVIKKDSHTTLH